MKLFIVALLLLTSACAFDPVITRRAGIRRVAEDRIYSCLQNPPGRPWNEKACIAESVAYCRSEGLEATCGIDGLYTRAPSGLRNYR